eukprot:6814996-Prymnesium_polylepis.1
MKDIQSRKGSWIAQSEKVTGATQPNVILALRARDVTLIPCYPCGRGRGGWAEQAERAGGHEDAHKRADDVYHAPEGLST